MPDTNLRAPVFRLSEGNGLIFRCPGCKGKHRIQYRDDKVHGWGWNGDTVKPTVSPSILVHGHKLILDADGEWAGGWELDGKGDPIPLRCHSFITDGRIQFLGDSMHELAGETVDLPPYTIG